VGNSLAYISHDDGKTWTEHPIFKDSKDVELVITRAFTRTRKGTIIAGFANPKELVWTWMKDKSDIKPTNKLPTYIVRSIDGGQTWEKPQKLHNEWTGDNSAMIQTADGRVVLSTMKMLSNPGRHCVLTYVSNDEGKTWKSSHKLDLGGIGHHGGLTEAALAELTDGRLWLLIRTNWGRFWNAYSDDGGLSWRTIYPSRIDASSAPGFLQRLKSGRLVLVWNRQYPEGKTSYELKGGDNQWSEVPVSNHREELSIAFSADDGKTWTQPVVIARKKKTWISYPYVLEAHPGQLWIFTHQGDLKVTLKESDFVNRKTAYP
jgi:hypothetical protein